MDRYRRLQFEVLCPFDITHLVLQCFLMHRIILESDANVIAGRVAMRGAEADVPLSEQVMFFTDFVQCQRMLYLPLL